MIRTSAYLLRVRGEPVGTAYGLENWQRASAFVCDRYGRTETTPRWAFDATQPTDTWSVLSERPWRPE
jgi:hypothetical protein